MRCVVPRVRGWNTEGVEYPEGIYTPKSQKIENLDGDEAFATTTRFAEFYSMSAEAAWYRLYGKL